MIKSLNPKILLFIYTAGITALSLWPSGDLPDVALFPYADKLIHAVMYSGFTFLLFMAWPEVFAGWRQILPLLIVAAWGIGMEMLQSNPLINRSFDLLDELANAAGFIPGWLAWKMTGKK